jgi:hypothetical protein
MSSEPPAQDAGTAAPGASAAAGNVAFIVSVTKPDPTRTDPTRNALAISLRGRSGHAAELAIRLIPHHRDADFFEFCKRAGGFRPGAPH